MSKETFLDPIHKKESSHRSVLILSSGRGNALNEMNAGQAKRRQHLRINTRRSGYLGKNSAEHPNGQKEAVASTSTGGHKERNQLSEESEDGHRVAQPGRDHHSAEEVVGRAHRKGHRRADAAVADSLPSEGVGESDVHTHPGHNSPRGAGPGTVHDSGPADCSHEEASDRIHPGEGRPDAGSETGMGRNGLHSSGSGEGYENAGMPGTGSRLMGRLTSATQVTRDPLNSRWSSFSTAVFRSAAVSNSTNLCPDVNGIRKGRLDL